MNSAGESEAFIATINSVLLGADSCHEMSLRVSSPEATDDHNSDLDTKKAMPDNDCQNMAIVGSGADGNTTVEAAGFEPASRDGSIKASTCVVVDLNFAR